MVLEEHRGRACQAWELVTLTPVYIEVRRPGDKKTREYSRRTGAEIGNKLSHIDWRIAPSELERLRK